MKKLLISIQILLLSMAANATLTNKHLANVAQVYADLNEGDVDLVEMNYWLGFGYKKADLKLALEDSETCRQAKNFKPLKDSKKASAAKKLTEMIRTDLVNGIDLVYPEDPDTEEYLELREALLSKMDSALQNLEEALDESTIELCEDSSIPAYSDGHTTTVVKIDGEIKFTYSVGYPD